MSVRPVAGRRLQKMLASMRTNPLIPCVLGETTAAQNRFQKAQRGCGDPEIPWRDGRGLELRWSPALRG
ncbi:hypothetical protein STEG23_004555 [Scotinomys teguina]